MRPGSIYFSILNIEDGSEIKASDIFREIQAAAKMSPSSPAADITSTDPVSNFTKEEYIASVKKVIDYIRAGRHIPGLPDAAFQDYLHSLCLRSIQKTELY